MNSIGKTTAGNLEEKFDAGEDVLDYFDIERGTHSNREPKRVNVDFPQWMVDNLDDEADRLGINRQAVIKILVDEGLQRRKATV